MNSCNFHLKLHTRNWGKRSKKHGKQILIAPECTGTSYQESITTANLRFSQWFQTIKIYFDCLTLSWKHIWSSEMLRTTYPIAQHIAKDLYLQDKHTICLLFSYHKLDFGEADTVSPFSKFSFFISQRHHTLFLCNFSLPSVYFCSRCPQSKGRTLSAKLLKLYGVCLGTYQNWYPPHCR